MKYAIIRLSLLLGGALTFHTAVSSDRVELKIKQDDIFPGNRIMLTVPCYLEDFMQELRPGIFYSQDALVSPINERHIEQFRTELSRMKDENLRAYKAESNQFTKDLETSLKHFATINPGQLRLAERRTQLEIHRVGLRAQEAILSYFEKIIKQRANLQATLRHLPQPEQQDSFFIAQFVRKTLREAAHHINARAIMTPFLLADIQTKAQLREAYCLEKDFGNRLQPQLTAAIANKQQRKAQQCFNHVLQELTAKIQRIPAQVSSIPGSLSRKKYAPKDRCPIQ